VSLENINGIRNTVDAVRNGSGFHEMDQQRIKEELIALLQSRGLLGEENIEPSGTAPETTHPASSLHLCPWGTCQATRHGSNK
jgi:hypothetical protein